MGEGRKGKSTKGKKVVEREMRNWRGKESKGRGEERVERKGREKGSLKVKG